MKRKAKKKMHPGVAVLILLGSAGYTAKSLLGGKPADDGPQAPAEAPAVVDGASVDAPVTETNGRDLLIEFGSYEKGGPVECAFRTLVDVAPAAPSGESQPLVAAGEWEGEDPPSLQLGVVMVSDKSRRAVLGGHVVGVGDEVAGAVVTAITTTGVVLQWHGRRLSYALDGDVPLEFRAELARRSEKQAKGEATPEDGGDAATPEKHKDEVK